MAPETRIRKLLLFFTLIALLTSCHSDTMFSEHTGFPSGNWSRFKPARFAVQISDTCSAASVNIIMRAGSHYPFRNIYLFVTVSAPGGTHITDTLEYTLADERGNRFGRGVGDIRELKLKYRTNVFFPASGLYIFEIEQAMRNETLPGVYDIGIRIERNAPKKNINGKGQAQKMG